MAGRRRGSGRHADGHRPLILLPPTAQALIACVYRASQWRHKDVELAAHGLLRYLDQRSG